MNYYPPMNHHHMSETSHFYQPPPPLPPNRFIYVKQNFLPPAAPPKVLLNPHFRQKVYVNPQFNPQPVPKPKIHVNPNMLKNFAVNVVPKVEPVQEEAQSTVISTRNKLVRIPCPTPEKRKRRTSLHTKYKIVRSSATAKNTSFNKFKLDKRPVNSPNRSIRKKYVYVNRFLSMDVVAKNVLLKRANLGKPGFVNINGILYKKSPNSLRKASDSSALSKCSRNTSLRKTSLTKSKYKIVRREARISQSSTPKPTTTRRSLVKRYKLIRSRKTKITPSKLRKCNIPCPIYRKFGKCKGKENGTCIKLHNPDQIVLCTRFLQGACRDSNCLFSHKVSLEKMPTCKYFLEGLCSKDDCPYLHVKISPKADICKDFLEGFCRLGSECCKRHQFLCPDFEKNKSCPRGRCPYPHGNTVRKSKKVLNTFFAKKCATKKAKKERSLIKEAKATVVVVEGETRSRYYKEGRNSQEGAVIKTVSKDRPKLGTLPAFIPFFEST